MGMGMGVFTLIASTGRWTPQRPAKEFSKLAERGGCALCQPR